MSWIKRLLAGKVMGLRSRPGQAGSCDVRVTRSGFRAQPTPAFLALWFQLESWQGSWDPHASYKDLQEPAQGVKKPVLTVSDLNPDPDLQHPILTHTHSHKHTLSQTHTHSYRH